MSEAELLMYIQGALPYLEDAWKACFRGQEEALLSAEERGMGRLLTEFRRLAAGERVMPPDCITITEAMKRVDNALAWAYALLGKPNDLKPELREWVRPGETCITGIERANAEVMRLRTALDESMQRCRESIEDSQQQYEEDAGKIKDLTAEAEKMRELLDLAGAEIGCSCGIEDAPAPCVGCRIEEMLTSGVVTTYPDLEDAKTRIMRVLSTTWMVRKSVQEKAHAGPLFDQALDELVKEKAIDFVQQDEGIYRLRSGPGIK